MRMPAIRTIIPTVERSSLRVVLVLWVLLAFLGVQIASATHPHDNACERGGHSCALCHAGHTPVVQVAAEIGAAPADLRSWGIQGEESPLLLCNLPASQLSRAPPA